MLLRVAFALTTIVALLLVEMPTSAQTYPPIVLRQLGRYPIVPSVSSTARLRAHRRELLAAAKTIPLTQGEYDALDAELTDPKVLQYGLIPRHLDAMTSGPWPYHTLHNVTIPPKQYGWHLTYSHGIHRTDIYIPNACGNVSVVRSIQRMARRRKRTTPANHGGALQPSPLPPTAAPSPSAAPALSPTPAAAYTPTPPPKKKKSFFAAYWPVLAGIVAMCVTQMRIGDFRLCSFGGHGSHGGPSPAPKPSMSSQPGPPPHTPTPAPTSSSQPGPPPHTPTPAPTPTAHPTTPPPTPTPYPSPTTHPTMTPMPTPTPMPSWTPMPTPTPRPTCTPKQTPTPSPTPTYCPLKPNHRSASALPKLVKDAIKAWGALSSPKDWQHVYFNFKLPF